MQTLTPSPRFRHQPPLQSMVLLQYCVLSGSANAPRRPPGAAIGRGAALTVMFHVGCAGALATAGGGVGGGPPAPYAGGGGGGGGAAGSWPPDSSAALRSA